MLLVTLQYYSGGQYISEYYTLEVILVNAVSHSTLLVHSTLAVSMLEDAVLRKSCIRHIAACVCCTLVISMLADAIIWS